MKPSLTICARSEMNPEDIAGAREIVDFTTRVEPQYSFCSYDPIKTEYMAKRYIRKLAKNLNADLAIINNCKWTFFEGNRRNYDVEGSLYTSDASEKYLNSPKKIIKSIKSNRLTGKVIPRLVSVAILIVMGGAMATYPIFARESLENKINEKIEQTYNIRGN